LIDASLTLSEEVAQLEALVKAQLSGCVRNLRLVVHDNGIILRGQAPTYYAKKLAQRAVRELTPRAVRANEIEVFQD
jgi:hypothetical protein